MSRTTEFPHISPVVLRFLDWALPQAAGRRSRAAGAPGPHGRAGWAAPAPADGARVGRPLAGAVEEGRLGRPMVAAAEEGSAAPVPAAAAAADLVRRLQLAAAERVGRRLAALASAGAIPARVAPTGRAFSPGMVQMAPPGDDAAPGVAASFGSWLVPGAATPFGHQHSLDVAPVADWSAPAPAWAPPPRLMPAPISPAVALAPHRHVADPEPLQHQRLPGDLPMPAPGPADDGPGSRILAEARLRQMLADIIRADALRHGLNLKER